MIALVAWWGLISGAVFTVVVLASWWFTPDMWLGDVTEGEQSALVTPASAAWFVGIVISFAGGGFVAAWIAAADHDAGFVAAALVAYAVMGIVNLVDLVVVDIAVFLWMRPSWMTLPNIEMPTDLGMHIRASLNGLLLAVPLAAVAGIVALAA